jgi:hypothetical protein
MTGGDVTSDGREILVRLLDATPLPTPGSDIAQLLASFEEILTERDAVLALIAPPLRVADADLPLLVELEQHQAAWQEALAAAQHAIGDQRCGPSQLRAYARRI